MAKYGLYSRRPPIKPRPWEIHPIWRGIGCLMIVLIPLLSYGAAIQLVAANRIYRWLPVPRELSQTVRLPFLGGIPDLFAVLLTAVVFALVVFAVITAAYALVYRLLGPPKYGPFDAPPIYGREKYH